MARKVVVAVAVVGAGQHDGADARDRLGPCLAEHRLGRSAAVFARPGHASGDEARDDRGRKGRATPAGHAPGELAQLTTVGRLLALIRACRVGVNESFTRGVDVDPAAVVAELGAAAPVGRQRADRNGPRERRRPEGAAVAVVACRGDQRDSLVVAKPPPEGLEAEQRKVVAGRGSSREADDVGGPDGPSSHWERDSQPRSRRYIRWIIAS
jgi:hypothetical protein